MSEALRYISGVIFLGLGGLIVLVQAAALIEGNFRDKSTSFIPFLGAMLLIAGAFAYPDFELRSFWWVALLLDVTIVPMGLLVLWQQVKTKNEET